MKYVAMGKKSPKTGTVMYYAQMAATSPLKLNDIAQNISRECTLTVHDIKAVLSALEEQIILALRNGNTIRFGDLGSFRPTLASNPVSTEKDVTAAVITSVHVRFTKSSKMSSEFQLTNENIKFEKA